jgi:hypothetical protein
MYRYAFFHHLAMRYLMQTAVTFPGIAAVAFASWRAVVAGADNLVVIDDDSPVDAP